MNVSIAVCNQQDGDVDLYVGAGKTPTDAIKNAIECPGCGHHFDHGEMDYICDRCGKICCSMCTENDEEDCSKVICNECLAVHGCAQRSRERSSFSGKQQLNHGTRYGDKIYE